jgi:isochorismate synthase
VTQAAHPHAAPAGWADALAAPWPGPGPWWVAVPAPTAPSWAALPEEAADVVALAPPEGPTWVGWGEAARVEAEGPERLARAAALVQARLTTLTPVGGGPGPVMLGGFAFEPEPVQDILHDDPLAEGWAALGSVTFVLPRFAYVVGADAAWLVAVCEDASPAARAATRAALDAARVRLAGHRTSSPGDAHRWPYASDERRGRSGRAPEDAPAQPVGDPSDGLRPAACPPPRPPVRLAPTPDGARARWRAGVASAQAAMAAGSVDKVVLSRRIPLVVRARVAARALWAALEEGPAGATRFLVHRAGHSFFGLTPERLVSKVGCEVRVDALAGSAAVGDELRLADPKEREEHGHVVRHLVARLAPWVDALEVPEAPLHRRLTYVTHLWTPIRGHLAGPGSVLTLAAALHPTPAVGGSPPEVAQAVLRAAEGTPRGWYAGGVGWVDAAGDGALFVALRSALLTPTGGAAFVGAGLVRGSDPDREWAETELKAAAVLRALGLEAGA